MRSGPSWTSARDPAPAILSTTRQPLDSSDFDLGALLLLKKRDREDLAWQAHRRLEAGDFENARRLFELLGRLWGAAENSAMLGQGVCAQRQGDLAAAERAYDRVLDAEPKNVYALANRAEVKLLTDRKDAARADLSVASTCLTDARVEDALRLRVEKLLALADDNS